MTIKIIKRGVPPEYKLFYGTCRNCKTEVEFMEKDGTRHESTSQRDGSYIEVVCPVCYKSIVVYA